MSLVFEKKVTTPPIYYHSRYRHIELHLRNYFVITFVIVLSRFYDNDFVDICRSNDILFRYNDVLFHYNDLYV